jgi:hypothetical protein
VRVYCTKFNISIDSTQTEGEVNGKLTLAATKLEVPCVSLLNPPLILHHTTLLSRVSIFC